MRVYLDNAATTPIAPEVIETMVATLTHDFGNPSSAHHFGRHTKGILETARKDIAALLNCLPSEIIFTSGGTEADNMALYSAVHSLGIEHIITSRLEHHAVLNTCEALEKENNIQISYVKVDSKGQVDLKDLESLLQKTSKTLVSLMYANNETGTLLPVEKVSQLCRTYNALFHSDTVQVMGHYKIDLNELDFDFITAAAHKFHGPKGIGFLYSNKKNKIAPLIHGGAQERGLRGGTENVAGIVGLAKALDLANTDLEKHQKHVQELKTYMMDQLIKNVPGVYFNGETDPSKSLYTVLNVSFPATPKTGMLLFTLDLKGVACSGGSACSSGAMKGSHVLEGIGADLNRPSVRFSFSHYTTQEEIDFALQAICEVFEVPVEN